MPKAAYDDIADWYEQQFLTRSAGRDPLGVDAAVAELLGHRADSADDLADGRCLEIGCGTGVHAARLRALGWTPIGVDLSAGMLRHARHRLPVLRADAQRLPLRDGSVPAVVAVLVHTDMPAYPAVLRDVARVLRPGGVFVHLGVHPCFCGGFADRSDPTAVVIGPGYLDHHRTTASWTDQGIRDKVGATHWPLPQLLHMFADAGLICTQFVEGGGPVPVLLGIRAVLAR